MILTSCAKVAYKRSTHYRPLSAARALLLSLIITSTPAVAGNYSTLQTSIFS